ncbi:MAG: GYD domain-containing protein [Candidatus Methanoperedens sp.]|nr:GYD domain-containing protein [Candidatus Methanoperedens sp.]MCZ7371747.1 GYD domain-containing protein [Candidatus Methanoperedens sp.]
MAKYIIVSKLTDEGAKTLKKNPGRVKEVNAELKDMDVNVLDQYAVLGDFDFLTIVEADDETTITKAAVEILSRGSIRTATYRAIPVDDFIESLR